MQKINSLAELRNEIVFFEAKKSRDALLLKEKFNLTLESLRPVNLIKNTFNEMTEEPDFKGNLLSTGLALASGYLSKKMAVGSTHNPIKQLFGTLLQIGITSLVAKNGDTIKAVGTTLLRNMFAKHDKVN
jgi:hypothetical protein